MKIIREETEILEISNFMDLDKEGGKEGLGALNERLLKKCSHVNSLSLIKILRNTFLNYTGN